MSDSVDFRQVELAPKQLKAIPVLLAARSITEGCRGAKISRETFYAWLKEPSFKVEYDRQGRAMIDEAFQALRGLTGKAVEVISKLLSSRQDGIKLSASKIVLEKFYPNRHEIEHSGKDGGPIEFTDTMRAAKLQHLLAKAARRAQNK